MGVSTKAFCKEMHKRYASGSNPVHPYGWDEVRLPGNCIVEQRPEKVNLCEGATTELATHVERRI
jgi:hypothetical protein